LTFSRRGKILARVERTDGFDPAGAPFGSAPPEAAERIDLLDYWRVLVQRRWVLGGCAAAVVLLGLLYAFLTTPEYQSTATLQIERQGPEILTFKDVMGVDPAGYQDFYQTQYRILQSRTVLRLAAERVDLPHRPEFAARRGSPLGRFAGWLRGLLAPATPAADAAPADPLDPAADFIAAGLTIQPVRNSHLVRVSFVDRDPALAAELANAVSEAYQQFNIDSRFDATSQASEFLTREVARLQAEISSLERQLHEYGTEKQIVAFANGAQGIGEKGLSEINARYIEAKGRRAAAEARYRLIRDAPPESFPEVLGSPLINNLKQQYAEVERRHVQMAQRFGPDWPPLAQLAEELARARARLELDARTIADQVRSVVRAEYDKLCAEVEGLEREVGRQRAELQREGRETIEYAGLQAEIQTRQKVLSDLVARQSETATSERLRDTRASNIRVVDRAVPAKAPVRPKKLLTLAVALILGLGLGAGMALLLDHVDNTVKDEQDVGRLTALPVLAHVPLYQPLRAVSERPAGDGEAPEADLASHHDPRSAFAEAFKNLRTSLLLASPDRPPRNIVVTSCEPGDGKSTVCLNLALVLTQMGRRVLVVDADLRRPRLHRMLGLAKDVGLSSALSGNAEAHEIIQETSIPGLLAVPSGPIPPNPSELLESPTLAALVERLREAGRFDHVFFDSPPALQVTDSVILASRMDASIVVVRAGKTARESLTQGMVRLRQSRGHVVGVVLNALSEESGYYYSRYGRQRYYRGYSEDDAAGTAARRGPRRLRHSERRGRKAERA